MAIAATRTTSLAILTSFANDVAITRSQRDTALVV